MKYPHSHLLKKYQPVISSLVVLLVGAGMALGVQPNETPRFSSLMRYGVVQVGGLTATEAKSKIDAHLRSVQIELRYGEKRQMYQPADLGIAANLETLREAADAGELALNLTDRSTAKSPLGVEEGRLARAVVSFRAAAFVPPVNASFAVSSGQAQLKPSAAGYGLAEKDIARDIVADALDGQGVLRVALRAQTLAPDISDAAVTRLLPDIQARMNTRFEIKTRTALHQASGEEVASWLAIARKDGAVQMLINEHAVTSYISQIANSAAVEPVREVTSRYVSGRSSTITQRGADGYRARATADLQDGLLAALRKGTEYKGEIDYETVAFTKTERTVDDTYVSRSFTYSVEVWGTVYADVGEFRSLAAETLNSSSGWGGAGIRFAEVASGGSFTLVLAEPARVAAISPICSSEYSCRVGRYVIINDQRWRTATPSWNGAGGSLRDYRHMVVNHETGHWLGFGHAYCSGSGQPAPVMQQQSISLQGCAFNPWPLESELIRARR